MRRLNFLRVVGVSDGVHAACEAQPPPLYNPDLNVRLKCFSQDEVHKIQSPSTVSPRQQLVPKHAARVDGAGRGKYDGLRAPLNDFWLICFV